MTQQSLADMVGVTRVAVSEWERDQSLPRVSSARQLSGILGIPEMDLTPLGGDGVVQAEYRPPNPPLEWREVSKMISALRSKVTLDDTSRGVTRYDMTVEDDSMVPVFAIGDRITVDADIAPWDGCYVVAVGADRLTGMLRNYRLRQYGGIDLWPNSPKYSTETIAETDVEGRVLGVVVAHERRFSRPDE